MTVERKSESTGTSWDKLSDVVKSYLVAHRVKDVATALATFTADAVVADEGRTYRGRDEIAAWLRDSGSEYNYTTEFSDAPVTEVAYAEVVQHLEGNFPGGVADLRFRFTLDSGLISRLVIAP